jgi:hypothetical protein
MLVSTGITLVLSTLGIAVAAESASLPACLELLQAKRKILRMAVMQSTTQDLKNAGFTACIWLDLNVVIVIILSGQFNKDVCIFLKERIVPTRTFVRRYFNKYFNK